ncbi:serine hydrolase domain-containing protein [Nocardioides daejeonensis]|uniref:serine hydrolase domain-containing protein n=1 Tax=Nocardioides daejeonensis TaxID=1046556 RepID=UPI000D746E9B|nr:serine hydrolase domain-containing protein [Nocardioides daejeonensis]
MVNGDCHAAFQPLGDLLARNLAEGVDAGASVAVVHDGELVVDLWGGEARPGVPWERDTVVQVWSVTKVMVGLAALVLADRGELDLDAPVAASWPAFAAHGKEHVLVRHVLGHSSGVPGWTPQISVEQALDLVASEALLADEAPWYEPGSAPAYQIVAHGHLVDGIVRGATGRGVAEVLRDDVLAPLGVDFLLGVPDGDQDRCADLISPPGSGTDYAALPPDAFLLRTIANPLLTPKRCNEPDWRRGQVGGAGGHGHARGIAQAQALVSHGGELGGVRLLRQETIDRIWEVQADGTDLLLMRPVRFGIGYGLPCSSAPAVPDRRVCWWTGYGGAVVVNDADTRTTVAYTPNKLADHMLASPRTDAYLRTAFDCLEAL